jgi:ankyrin repeat protein
MMAALFGRIDVVRLLVAHGADPTLKDLSGNTAAGLARQQGNAEMAALIEGR